ncbi:MAG: dihydrofolate reductase [Granulosicoccaceae bacterium]
MTNEAANEAIKVCVILAMDRNKLIGKEGGMPWHIPGELANFKSVTMGHPVIMGRKTFDSIGKPLPGRLNVVVTRNKEWQAEGAVAVTSLADAMDVSKATVTDAVNPQIMIIGGAALCRDAMPFADRLYLTFIDHEYEGDTWFDSYSSDDWREVSRCDVDPAESNDIPISYRVLERANNCG